MKKTGIIMLGFLLLAGWAAAETIGLVVAAEGKASATDAAGAGRALGMKSDIRLNDTVKTEARSRLQILLNDDTLLAVGENSEMLMDEYVYNPAGTTNNSFGVKLGKGIFRTVTGKITDLNPDRFKVKTRLATIGIRGCDLGFDTTGEDEDTVAVLAIPKGKKVIVTATASGKTLTVETPTFVTINSRGIIFQRDLTPADHKAVPQGAILRAELPDKGGLKLSDTGSLTQPGFTPFADNSVIQGTAQHGFHETGREEVGY
jgi:hypothetical protein